METTEPFPSAVRRAVDRSLVASERTIAALLLRRREREPHEEHDR